MKRIAMIAATAVLALPAWAGETPYNPGGVRNNPSPDLTRCNQEIEDATRKLIFLPQDNPNGHAIALELEYARSEFSQGHGQKCLTRAENALKLEQ
ncbi:MAG TPA: hypothetical protein VLW75_08860 [Rhizomicrobium sp.]|nr:hypothetical protein [Rhizomicrobium sp.]